MGERFIKRLLITNCMARYIPKEIEVKGLGSGEVRFIMRVEYVPNAIERFFGYEEESREYEKAKGSREWSDCASGKKCPVTLEFRLNSIFAMNDIPIAR